MLLHAGRAALEGAKTARGVDDDQLVHEVLSVAREARRPWHAALDDLAVALHRVLVRVRVRARARARARVRVRVRVRVTCATKGVVPVRHSYVRMPTHHQSAPKAWPLLRMISGARYLGGEG